MDLNEQFTPLERANLLLGKYRLLYIKDIVNGFIKSSKENNEMERCNYWNEVAKEIKKQIK